MAKKPRAPGVPKVEALEILLEAREVTAEEYAEAVRKREFENVDIVRAHRILARLRAQGLVERDGEERRVQYVLPNLPGRPEPIQRRQRVYRWRITEKGVARMEFLRQRKREEGESSQEAETATKGRRKASKRPSDHG